MFPKLIYFICFFLSYLNIQAGETSGINVLKEHRETLVSNGRAYIVAVKVKGFVEITAEGRNGSVLNGRFCLIRATQKTYITKPCIIDYRNVEDLPLKATPDFRCSEDYQLVSLFTNPNPRETNSNCNDSWSLVTGAYLDYYGDPEFSRQVEVNSLGQFYQFLNEEQQALDEISYVKAKSNNSDLESCALVPTEIRKYCSRTNNCSVNVNDKNNCIKVFNREGINYLDNYYYNSDKSLESNTSHPLVFSASLVPNAEGNYSSVVIPNIGSSGDSRGSFFASSASRYENWLRAAANTEKIERENLYNNQNKNLNPRRNAYSEQEKKYKEIESELANRRSKDDFKFVTSNSDPDYNKLYYAEERRIDAEREVLLKSHNTEDKKDRQILLDVAKFQNRLADRQLAQGNRDIGMMLLKGQLEIIDIALDFSPVGSLKNAISFITGYNLAGRKLSNFERAVSLAGVFLPGLAKIGGIGILKLGSLLKAASLEAWGIKLAPIFINIIKNSDDELKFLSSGNVAKELGAVTDEVIETASDVIEIIGARKFDEILHLPKGSRPAPESYLPAEYIQNHLSKFEDGASRLTTKQRLDTLGPAHKDGTAFIMPKNEVDELLVSSNGNKREIETAIGLRKNHLDGDELVRIDIPEPKELNLRIPSGNEAGASELWLPGGKLPGGKSEAVIDLGESQAEKWTSKIIKL
jgi:hypothetical protein